MINWKNPSQEELAALKMATQRKVQGLTEFQAAELIIYAKGSLWYTQAKRWAADTNPQMKSLQGGAEVLLQIVDTGYHAEHGWWYIAPLWATATERAKAMFKLCVMLFSIEVLRQESTMTISQGFTAFAQIVLGPEWRKMMALAVTKPPVFMAAAVKAYSEERK